MYYPGMKLGIIKGGQLGRMLIQAAMNFGLTTFVLDDDPDAPCRSVCGEFTQGDPLDHDTVYRFGRRADLVTLEFENVNIDALKKLEKENVVVYPQPGIIEIAQDKGLQKKFYKEKGIPAADFILLNCREDLLRRRDLLPGIQKLRRSGYDGRGVRRIDSQGDIAAQAFDEPSIFEKVVEFEKEIAVLVARNFKGDMASYPPVEFQTYSEKNLLSFLTSPAEIDVESRKKADEIARRVAGSLGIVGILAVEMFVTSGGGILVNEIAPRPHNSGHHTIESNWTSQYEQHLRAIMNLPMGSTEMKSPAVMINLIGESGSHGPARLEGIDEILKMKGVYVHFYGKKITEPFRKMGHITILDDNIEKAKEKAKWIKQRIRCTA